MGKRIDVREMMSWEVLKKYVPHIIAVVILFVFPFLINYDVTENAIGLPKRYKNHFHSQLIFMIVAFYCNYLYFFPRFYHSEKKLKYLLIQIVFIVILLFGMQFWFEYFLKQDRQNNPGEGVNQLRQTKEFLFIHPRFIDNLFFLVLVSGLSTSISILEKKSKEEKVLQEKEKAHIDTELAFLRNQVSPHFFFNALNNIYALIAIDADRAQESVERLSELMRYLIYESDIKTVPVRKEFEFVENYIVLMRQRVSSHVSITVDIEQTESNLEIPPLLFIPFVENAFKHGVSYREKSEISISLQVKDDQLLFACSNTIVSEKEENLNNKGGLGIQNSKKRLSLLYADRAQLNIQEVEGFFEVKLEVPLFSTTS